LLSIGGLSDLRRPLSETVFAPTLSAFDQSTGRLDAVVVDAATGKPMPARVYVGSEDGKWYFPKSADPGGTAVEYRKQRQAGSVEMHTTLSAHPFTVALPPGKYVVRAERGKEYLPVERAVVVGSEPVKLRLELRRWIDMASRGWFSGDTHVHRTLAELPNVVLAEDLNVALPLTYWVTTSHTPPTQGNRAAAPDLRPEPIHVDATHLVYPVNTEYEIFTVAGKPHTLGAVFILGHKTGFELGVPPVRPIADRARREGALLDLDKHSWPWSLMLVPVMDVDLFELANNHVWQTEFGFTSWTLDTVPAYMGIERTAAGFTEWGWIDFGFQTYYALLNAGFRLRPTAGTASGVHPVPLGFGRVYVQVPEGLSYESWIRGLNAGRSFVTTGPMLFVEVNGRAPGHRFAGAAPQTDCHVTGAADSAVPLDRIELVVNGRVARTLTPQNQATDRGSYRSAMDEHLALDGSAWVAVRVFEKRPDRRVRFAHSSPVFFDVPAKPIRPRPEEIDSLIRRVEQELKRNESVLTPEALDEYRAAIRWYRSRAEPK
jgi:hypothetical protein